MKKHYTILGCIGQWMGLLMCTIGTVLLFVTKHDIANVLISSSSVMWGIATKIKYYGNKYRKGVFKNDLDNTIGISNDIDDNYNRYNNIYRR